MRNYFERFKQYLYDKEILPIIKTSQTELSVEEIAEKMKPVPYESIRNKLPTNSAKTLRLIYEN